MKCQLELYIEEYNGTAGLSIADKNTQTLLLNIKPNSLTNGNHQFDLELSDDTIYIFKMYGKDQNFDTKVDDNGNIIKDKHIKILGLTIHYLYLQEKEFYSLDFDPYYGFNGICKELYIPQKIHWPQWYLKIRKKINEMSKTNS